MIILDRGDYEYASETIERLHLLESTMWGLNSHERTKLKDLKKEMQRFEKENPEYRI